MTATGQERTFNQRSALPARAAVARVRVQAAVRAPFV